MGYGVIGSPTGSGPVSLGSSPSTPAIWSVLPSRLEFRSLHGPPLCSGLARRPLKAVAPVRIRSGVRSRRAAPPSGNAGRGRFGYELAVDLDGGAGHAQRFEQPGAHQVRVAHVCCRRECKDVHGPIAFGVPLHHPSRHAGTSPLRDGSQRPLRLAFRHDLVSRCADEGAGHAGGGVPSRTAISELQMKSPYSSTPHPDFTTSSS
jgi:hypothetical protein